MSNLLRPMLACPAPLQLTRWPYLVSPKLDGIRALIQGGRVISRSGKLIPNQFVQSALADAPEGLDGELIVGVPFGPDVMRRTTSGVMSADGEPAFTFHAFDLVGPQPFLERLGLLGVARGRIRPVAHKFVANETELLEYETAALEAGYEGVMLRAPDGPYKHGRSTVKEGYLMKLKRFQDAEATVIHCVERTRNANEAKLDELGYAKRSTHQANQIPCGDLGALECVTPDGIQFAIGSGFTAADREQLWARRETLVGRLVKYKHFPYGAKDAPRLPVFLGWRDPIDL